jgi:uncharacterized repeat protein (TIGR03943 family)
VRRDAQAVLLLLVGGTLLKIGIAGTYVRYVKPGQLWLLLAAGAVLLTVAGVTLWDSIRGTANRGGAHTAYAVEAAAEADGLVPAPSDDHGQPWVAWLLLVPALALLIFSPPALGSFQASRNGTALGSRASSDYAPLPAGDPVSVTLLDYASRAVFDRGQSLAGRRVQLTGFVIAGPSGQPYLARMIVSCCAADARPVKVGLAGDVPSNLRADEWVEVVGTYTERSDRDPVNGETIPYVQVASVRGIPAPNEPYET